MWNHIFQAVQGFFFWIFSTIPSQSGFFAGSTQGFVKPLALMARSPTPRNKTPSAPSPSAPIAAKQSAKKGSSSKKFAPAPSPRAAVATPRRRVSAAASTPRGRTPRASAIATTTTQSADMASAPDAVAAGQVEDEIERAKRLSGAWRRDFHNICILGMTRRAE